MRKAESLGPEDVGKKIYIEFTSGDRVYGTLKRVRQDLSNYQTDYSGQIEALFDDGFSVSTTVTVAIANQKLKIPMNPDRVASVDIMDSETVPF